MAAALQEARRALRLGEVPVGAVIVVDDQIVARGCNQPIGTSDATAHAEVQALRAAGQALGNYRLTGATLYVTLEPCLMCVGALVHARMEAVVFGAADPKSGALGSVVQALELGGLNHQFGVAGGVLEAEARELLQGFFRQRRVQLRVQAPRSL